MVSAQRTGILIYLAVIFALIVGCSGGGAVPTSPDTSGPGLTPDVSHTGASSPIIWETGEVTIDPEEGTAEVVPLRTVDMTLNVVKFLQPPDGDPSNLSVELDLVNSDFLNAYVELDCSLTHPFPGSNFWGFDVRIIVFAGGSNVGMHDPTVTWPTTTELRMVNADGYSRWFNYEEFAPQGKIFGYTNGIMAPIFTTNWSHVNGYKYFAEGIGLSDVPPNPDEAGRGVFSEGTILREMKLQFPQVPKPFKFKYSIAASWQMPTTTPPESVDDFPAAANCQEAYQIVVRQDEDASTACYDPDTGTGSGDLALEVEVWDWQADGAPEDEIAGIYLESPTMMDDAVEITGTWTAGAGTSPNSVVYSGTLEGVHPTDFADQELFITVESADPTTYEPPLAGFLYPDSPLAAFQVFTCLIKPCGPPPKSITVEYPDGGEVFTIGDSETITWTHTGDITDVIIEYSTDGGDTYPNVIVPSVPCADHEYLWDPIPDTPTTEAKVKITEIGTPPVVSDESDDNFTIQEPGEPGWNALYTRPVDDPEPNQSTVSPDFGIQNDGEGNEGAWMVDQEGGVGDGTPYFFDYSLDWSGPDGDAYPSGFNYNPCPFGRIDPSSNAIALFGCFYNEEQINPPLLNDPYTCIWWLSYLIADEGFDPGELLIVTWGDEGSEDPPEDDPDERPWFHTADLSSGIPGTQGDQLDNCMVFLMPYSNHPDAPVQPDEEQGDLHLGFWNYPYYSSNEIYRLGFPDFTTLTYPAPPYQAFDVSDPSSIRLAADSDSFLTFSSEPPIHLAIMCYMIDTVGNWYGSGFQIDYDQMMFWYIPLENTLKMNTQDTPDLWPEDWTAVDLEVLPAVTYIAGGDSDIEKNWVAVLFDDNSGNFVVRVYRVDWTVETDEITEVDTTDPISGTPLSIDVDPVNFRIHVLADDGGTIEATVFDYTE